MVSLVTDYIQDTAAKYLGLGITAVGTLAGNAVGGVGGLIENSGRTLGNGVAGGIGGVGGYINGYGNSLKGSMAADGPVRGGTSKSTAKQSGKIRDAAIKAPASKSPSTSAVRSTIAKPSTPAGKVQSPAVHTLTTSQTSKALPKKPSNGKVVISAESKPRKAPARVGDASKTSTADQKLSQPTVRPAVTQNTRAGPLGV
ncbi:hypothetical protein AMS68_001596 [Peltaster fructicola]|uniref:Uncharacterized protein n=1 Tax=Peltaster fructicola TaxID=286661 RepID=A0A6H0XN78_9PEZI|nr:hypothetical protein AMS68_001596 [Peltaster fructicola]